MNLSRFFDQIYIIPKDFRNFLWESNVKKEENLLISFQRNDSIKINQWKKKLYDWK